MNTDGHGWEGPAGWLCWERPQMDLAWHSRNRI